MKSPGNRAFSFIVYVGRNGFYPLNYGAKEMQNYSTINGIVGLTSTS